MFLVFSQLAFADMRQAIVLVVLREVESDLFTVGRDAHRDEAVNELVAQPTHEECIEEYDGDGKQMVEEYHEAVHRACNESLLNKDTCQHGAENATRAVRGEYIERIVDTLPRTPINGDVTNQCDDKGNEDALSHCNVTSRRCDGYETDYTSHRCTHRRWFAATQAVEEYPCHHRSGRGCVCIEKCLDGLSVGME